MPGDELLDAAAEAVSVGLAEMICRLGECCDFRRAAEHLERLAQVKVSHDTVRQIATAEGRAVLAAEKAGALPAGWSAEDCAVDGTAITRVYLGVDGVKVPTVTDAEKKSRRRKVKARRRRCGKKRRALPRLKAGTDQRWKEAKLVVYYDQSRTHRLVSAGMGDAAECGRRMRRDGRRINLSRADDRLGLFDGADWIRNQVRAQSLPLDALGLDFYHLAQHVHAARRAVWGEDEAPTGPGMTWADDALHAVVHDGCAALWEKLLELRAGVGRRKAARTEIDRLMGYVAARREMIDYPLWRDCGRDIGSGPTEAMCKAMTMRLKGPGMRWDPDNVEAIMALTALRLSDRWTAWWTIRLRAA